jgi:hypothetical protein
MLAFPITFLVASFITKCRTGSVLSAK